jgi:D-serine deaminase-like pyridoxal phosphate-dependent protein
MSNQLWYTLNHPNQTDSPALLVYPDRIHHNIREMIRIAGSPDRLVPHVKTHKMSEVIKMHLEAGIRRFKCATIAEAEMLATSGAKNILLAYQLNESKALRFIQLIKRFPLIQFASLVDNMDSAQMLQALFAENNLNATVYIDVDDGMHRTGMPVEKNIAGFYQQLAGMSHLHCAGLHVYDGHIRDQDFEQRKIHCDNNFKPVMESAGKILSLGFPKPEIIAGGSPTFPIHALNPEILCSPGTTVLWDRGDGDLLKDLPFLHAAVLLTRIISKPAEGRITTDLGHKSVAAENPINKRIFFLNIDNYEVISESEEHLVVEVSAEEWDRLKIGDVLYGVPYHVCPTVALYDEVQVIDNGDVITQWNVEARKKKISV